MQTTRGARWAYVLAFLPASIALADRPAAGDRDRLEEIVVTAARMTAPLTVVTDAKAPRQPVPAHDGADFLKTVPGFSVIRKGGTDGDPVFRGMAASRVNILLDGEQALGGCGMRMDPPTAYVFPEAYDRIVVVKGPQTVLHGPGNSAASVSFERDAPRFDRGGLFGLRERARRQRQPQRPRGRPATRHAVGVRRTHGHARGIGRLRGRHRHDRALALRALERERRARLDARATPPGLKSAESAATAKPPTPIAPWTASMFDRDNAGLRTRHTRSGPGLRGVEAQAYYNYVDHVMDNYSLRDFTPSPTMPVRQCRIPTGARPVPCGIRHLPGPGGTVATVGRTAAERHSLVRR